MMWVSGAIGAFIERHPTIKILALAFLILVGVVLIAEALPLRRAEGLPVLRHGVLGGRRNGEYPPAAPRSTIARNKKDESEGGLNGADPRARLLA